MLLPPKKRLRDRLRSLRRRDLLDGIEVELEWADGEMQQSQMPGAMDVLAGPRVRYLPQQFGILGSERGSPY